MLCAMERHEQEPEVGNFFFGRNHPMKPHRVRLTHELLEAFSLNRKLLSLPAARLTTSEMSKYHADEYAPSLLPGRSPTPHSPDTACLTVQLHCAGTSTF